MSDTPEQPTPSAAAPTVEAAAVPAPVPEKPPEVAQPPGEVAKPAAPEARVETFDNPQFRPGEFTPYASPAHERPAETTANTPPPAMPQAPTEEVKAVAPTMDAPARPVELTANAPASYPAPLPASTGELPTSAPAPAPAPPPPAPPPPTPALPTSRLASSPPPPKGAPVGAFAGFAIGGYLLGVLSAVAVLGTRPSPEPHPPSQPPAATAPEAPAPPPALPSTPTPAAAADDIPVPETEPAPSFHHEREHEREHEHEHEGAVTEHHHSSATAASSPAAPAPTPSAPATGALKVYETATLAEALQAAKQANNTLLATRLSQLISARERAEEARRDKDPAKESASLDEAYRVDLSIDRGAGPYHRSLQEEAVRLHLQLGDQAVARRDTLQASTNFRQALAIQPDSGEAKKKLTAMGQRP